MALARKPRRLGFDDGVIIPPERYPLGTSMKTIQSAAAVRKPLRGAVRVVVVLAEFTDRALGPAAQHFRDLFFSTGVLPHGSVREYYREVTGGLVDIVGEVVGPFRLPHTLAWYANGNFGIGQPSGEPRANVMAQDAAKAADPLVDFTPYDNDGNGFVDAFIVVHAGGGGEQTGSPGDIWSHKWTLPSAYAADGAQIYAYLTIPEDARIGVCAHELGHLLFGFPDLYDTDYTSEGIGNWCLMAGGSWNGGGDVPAHPSAWCKADQGWASVTNVTTARTLSLPDVKTSRKLHRLWKNGKPGAEYFLLENRQRTGYDAELPGRRAPDLAHRRVAVGQHRRDALHGGARAGGRRSRPRARSQSRRHRRSLSGRDGQRHVRCRVDAELEVVRQPADVRGGDADIGVGRDDDGEGRRSLRAGRHQARAAEASEAQGKTEGQAQGREAQRAAAKLPASGGAQAQGLSRGRRAMVQAVENLTCVEGVVRACRRHPSLPDRTLVTLAVQHAEPVAGKADLMTDVAGRDLDVAVPSALLGRVQGRRAAALPREAHPGRRDVRGASGRRRLHADGSLSSHA